MKKLNWILDYPNGSNGPCLLREQPQNPRQEHHEMIAEFIGPSPQREFHAELATAAPKLLEAATQALPFLVHLAAHGTLPPGTTLGDLPVLQLQAAIAKATQSWRENEERIAASERATILSLQSE